MGVDIEKKDNVYVEADVVPAPDDIDADILNEQKEEHFVAEDAMHYGGVHATKEDIEAMEARLDEMPATRARKVLETVYKMHKHDQNFDIATLNHIEDFLFKEDVQQHPERYTALTHAMRLEALFCMESSPYAMVRSSVDVTDDPNMPSLTFRVWALGILACTIGSFVNQLFTIRYPGISIGTSLVQLVAYPLGRFLARVLPTTRFDIFGWKCSLNPGPFSRKEHMLIVIMSSVGMDVPYMTNIIFVQAMPQWYGQEFAKSYGYQILNTLGSQLAGYGLAGLCRCFLVYPSSCVWPSALSTLALNKAFHTPDSGSVEGPFKRLYKWSKMKLFYIAFTGMFFYFWIPNTLMSALTIFNWIAWISPNNKTLTNFTSLTSGLGINPWVSFDWNYAFMIDTPTFSVTNRFIGMVVAMFMIIGIYYRNTYNTGYLPMMGNNTWDNKGKKYNVQKIMDERKRFNMEKYQAYSEPYMNASNIVNYFFFFSKYTSVLTYTAIYNWRDIGSGFKMLYSRTMSSWPFNKVMPVEEENDPDAVGEDVHFRLMKKYNEVPEWWYFTILVLSLVLGMLGVACYPTETTPAVVIYGVVFALIFMVPLGITNAVTGVTPTLNVLAEFIGGVWAKGNALEMNYFKMYGYITSAHALSFSRDLKLGHYTKIPPRHTFLVQIVGTLINAFVTTSLFNWQMSFKDVCTPDAAFRFLCIGQTTFFTASVFWGTIGPERIFGKGSRFWTLLIGFPVGVVVVIVFYFLQKMYPKSRALRSLHPVAIFIGAHWYPTTLGEFFSYLITTVISWNWIKTRYLGFWTRYNYVLSTAFSAGVAISGVVQFLCLGLTPEPITLDWWGNNPDTGCNKRGNIACANLKIPEKGFFGPDPGNYH